MTTRVRARPAYGYPLVRKNNNQKIVLDRIDRLNRQISISSFVSFVSLVHVSVRDKGFFDSERRDRFIRKIQ